MVGWVLDLPRRLFGVSFYTEQFLAVCLGLSLALAFINARLPAALVRLAVGGCCRSAICGYIAVRYEALTYEIALLPTEGIIGSAILIAAGAGSDAPHRRRRAGRHHSGHLGLCVHRPAYAGRLRHPARCRRRG